MAAKDFVRHSLLLPIRSDWDPKGENADDVEATQLYSIVYTSRDASSSEMMGGWREGETKWSRGGRARDGGCGYVAAAAAVEEAASTIQHNWLWAQQQQQCHLDSVECVIRVVKVDLLRRLATADDSDQIMIKE